LSTNTFRFCREEINVPVAVYDDLVLGTAASQPVPGAALAHRRRAVVLPGHARGRQRRGQGKQPTCVHEALAQLGTDAYVRVSTANSLAVLDTSYPPEARTTRSTRRPRGRLDDELLLMRAATKFPASSTGRSPPVAAPRSRDQSDPSLRPPPCQRAAPAPAWRGRSPPGAIHARSGPHEFYRTAVRDPGWTVFETPSTPGQHRPPLVVARTPPMRHTVTRRSAPAPQASVAPLSFLLEDVSLYSASRCVNTVAPHVLRLHPIFGLRLSEHLLQHCSLNMKQRCIETHAFWVAMTRTEVFEIVQCWSFLAKMNVSPNKILNSVTSSALI
jgi:hypothetical protein